MPLQRKYLNDNNNIPKPGQYTAEQAINLIRGGAMQGSATNVRPGQYTADEALGYIRSGRSAQTAAPSEYDMLRSARQQRQQERYNAANPSYTNNRITASNANQQAVQMYSNWAERANQYLAGNGDDSTANMLKSHYKTLSDYLDKYGSDFDEQTAKTLRKTINMGHNMINQRQKQLKSLTEKYNTAQQMLNTDTMQFARGLATDQDAATYYNSQQAASKVLNQKKPDENLSPFQQRWAASQVSNDDPEQTEYEYNILKAANGVKNGEDLSLLTDDQLKAMRAQFEQRLQSLTGNERQTTASVTLTQDEWDSIHNPNTFNPTAEDYAVQNRKTDYDVIKDAIDRITKTQSDREYMGRIEALRGNSDFAQNSRYTPQAYLDNREDIPEEYKRQYSNYDIINRNKAALDELQARRDSSIGQASLSTAGNPSAVAMSSLTASKEKYDTDTLTRATDDEISMYNYLMATDPEEAETYLAFLYPQLQQRQSEMTLQEAQEFADKYPVSASLLSSVGNFYKGLALPGTIAEKIVNDEVNPNSFINTATSVPSAMRSRVGQNIQDATDSEILNQVYQAGMSALDNYMQISALGGIGGGALAEEGVLVIMGTGAAQESIIQNKRAGMDDDRAFIMGITAGAIEVITEKIGMDNLFNSAFRGKTVFKDMLKQMAAEGGEEGLSDALNLIADEMYDTVTGQSQSEWKKRISEYMSAHPGASDEEAFRGALLETLKQQAYSIGGGALSAVLLGGGTAISNVVNDASMARTVKNNAADSIEGLLDTGLQADLSSEAYHNAERLKNKLDAGETLTNEEIAQQYKLNVKAERYGELDVDRIKPDDTAEEIADEEELTEEQATEEPTFNYQQYRADNAQMDFSEMPEGAEALLNGLKDYSNSLKAAQEATEAARKAEDESGLDIFESRGTRSIEVTSDKYGASGNDIYSGVIQELTDKGYTLDQAEDAFQRVYESGFSSGEISYVPDLSDTANRAIYEAGFRDNIDYVKELKDKGFVSASNVGVQYNANDENDVVVKALRDGRLDQTTLRNLNTIMTNAGVPLKIYESSATHNGLMDESTGAVILYLDSTFLGKNASTAKAVYATAWHELTHRLQQVSPESYVKLQMAVRTAMGENRYAAAVRHNMRNNPKLNEAMAQDEVVADFIGLKFGNAEFTSKLLGEITSEEMTPEQVSLFQKFRNIIRAAIDFFKGNKGAEARANVTNLEKVEAVLTDLLGEVQAKVADSERIEVTDQMFDTINETAQKEGNIETPDNYEDGFRPSIKSAFEYAGIDAVMNEKTGLISYTYDGKAIDHVTAEHIKTSGVGAMINLAVSGGNITQAEANKQYKAFADIMNMIMNTQNPDLVWQFVGSEVFSAVKSNSDNQYGTTVDFSTICKKTQDMITAMSEAMIKAERGLTISEVTELQARINNNGMQVPCPVCYVFSRWAGIGSVLDQMSQYQKKYPPSMSMEEIQEAYNKLSKESRTERIARLLKEDAAYKDLVETRQAEMAKKKDLNKQLKQARKDGNDVMVGELTKAIKVSQDLIKEYKKMMDAVDKSTSEASWLMRTRMSETYKPVPTNILFDLDAGATIAKEYPDSWNYRMTRGAGKGKAILPYSDFRFGALIDGPKNNGKFLSKGADVLKTGQFNKEQQGLIENAKKRVKAQNLIGGQRYQSTSDFRYDYALDYLMSFLEAQALGSNLQTYTKVIEYAELIAAVGGDVNLSVMPLDRGYDDDGNLLFSSVTGINVDAAKRANRMYDSAQLILVGINDRHINLALADPEITFVIPWHASGASNDFTQALLRNLGEDYNSSYYQNYEDVQSDHVKKNATADQKYRAELRKTILMGGKLSVADIAYLENLNASEDVTSMSFEEMREIEKRALKGNKEALEQYLGWSDAILYDLYQKMTSGEYEGVNLNSSQAEAVMPHEYWNKDTTIDNAYVNGFIFRSYCYSLGLVPRFTGVNSSGKALSFGDFSDNEGYWKTLIDRPMYNNNGTYREQNKVNLNQFQKEYLQPEHRNELWSEYATQMPDASKARRVGAEYGESLRRSVKDSAGNTLSQGQMDYFEDSKVRDENGNLKVMYHGTGSAGFTIFDNSHSDDGRSFFFTDNVKVAESYSATKELFIADKDYSYSELNNIIESYTNGENYVEKTESGYRLMELGMIDQDDNIVLETDDLAEINTYFVDNILAYGIGNSANYPVYLNITNPLDIDAQGNNWNELEEIWNKEITTGYNYFMMYNDLGDGRYEIEYSDYDGSGTRIVTREYLESILKDYEMEDFLDGREVDDIFVDQDGVRVPATTRDYAEYAQDNGYDGVLFNNIVDNGIYGNRNMVSNIAVAFNSNQVKSINNQNPTENPDIRYSLKSNETFDYEGAVREEQTRQDMIASLQEDVNRLSEENEKLRQQFKRRPVDEKDFAKRIKKTVKGFGSTVNSSEISADLLKAAKEFYKNPKAQYSNLHAAAIDAASQIVKNAVEEFRDPYLGEAAGFLRTTPIRVSQQIKNDFGDWNDLRKSYMGRLVLTNNSGSTVDQIYSELSNTFNRNLFPEDIVNPTDQLERIMEVVDSARAIYMNPYDGVTADAIDDCAYELMADVLDAAHLRTFADRQAEAREELRKKMQKQSKERLDRLRAEKNERYDKLQQYYRDMAERNRTRKYESADRKKLLELVRRLNRMKTTQANRALIAELVGEIDDVAMGITGSKINELSRLREWYNHIMETDENFVRDSNIEAKIDRLGKKHINGITKEVGRAASLAEARALQAQYQQENPDAELSIKKTPGTNEYIVMSREGRMSIEDVRDLLDVLKNVENEIRTANKLIADEDRRETYLMAQDIIADVEATKGVKDGVLGAFDRYIVQGTLSPERAVRRFTGYNENDPLYKATLKLSEGQRNMLDFQYRAGRKFMTWTQNSRYMKSITGSKAQTKTYTFKDIKGRTVNVEITPAMRISLYLHSKNAQNLSHIVNGGLTLPGIESYRKGNMSSAYDKHGVTVRLTPSQIRQITSDMSETDRAFARAVHDYFNNMSQTEINNVSEMLQGYSLAQVEDYFPINTDSNFLRKDYGVNPNDATIKGMGFLKERINATNPVILRDVTDVLKQSIDQTSKYVGLAIPVDNINKLMKAQSGTWNQETNKWDVETTVKKALAEKWDSKGKDYLNKLMTDIQSPGERRPGRDKLFSKVRSHYAGAVLTLNLSVAMKQAASYPTAAAVVGWGPLIKAMKDFGSVDLDLIAKYTPLQWYRTQGFSTQELGDIKSQNKMMANLPKALNWIQGVDLLTTRKLWKAAEIYIQDTTDLYQKGKGKNQSDDYYRAVADIYNQIIEETQPNYTTMQRPELLRTRSAFTQAITMFKTQPFQNFNITFDAVANFQAKKRAYLNATDDVRTQAKTEYETAKKKLGWMITSQVGQLFTFATMTLLWNLFRGKLKKYKDDDDELTAGSLATGVGKDMASSLFSEVPFGAEMWEFISSKLFGDTYYGFDSVATSAVNDMVSALGTAADAVSDLVTGKKNLNSIRLQMDNVMKTVSKVVGLPIENVENLFNAVFQQIATGVNKYTGTYAYLQLTTDPAKTTGASAYYDNLYKAYENDREAYEQIRQDMIDSGAFEAEKIDEKINKYIKEKNNLVINPSKYEGIDMDLLMDYSDALKNIGFTSGTLSRENAYNALSSMDISDDQREELWAVNGWTSTPTYASYVEKLQKNPDTAQDLRDRDRTGGT